LWSHVVLLLPQLSLQDHWSGCAIDFQLHGAQLLRAGPIRFSLGGRRMDLSAAFDAPATCAADTCWCGAYRLMMAGKSSVGHMFVHGQNDGREAHLQGKVG
jgi:hypothetical protein